MTDKENTKPFYNSTIPGDWEIKTLGELVTDMKSGLSRELSNEDIGLPVIRSNNLIDNKVDFDDIKYWHKTDNQGAKTENYYLSDGDILVNFINSISQIGKCAYFTNTIKRPVIFTTNILVVRFDKNLIDSRFFLFYSLQNHYKKFVDSITKPAVNQASFTTKDYKKLILPLPPLPEQKAIAHILSIMDTAINKNNLLIAKKELQKKWLMQNLLTGKKSLKGFDGKWKTFKISQLGQIVTGNTPSMAKPEYYGDKYYWATAFDFEGVYINNTKIRLSEEGKSVARIVPKGSILVTCIASIGKNAIANVEMAFNQQINAIIPNMNFNSEFIYYIIEASLHKLKEVAGAGAVSIINKSNFETIKLKFPSIEEQTAIAQVLQTADKEILLLKAKTEKLREEKKGMMQVLLTGKKRLRP